MPTDTSHDTAIGIDFGTTNTVIALAGPDGKARAVTFEHGSESLRVFLSALCFWEERREGALQLLVEGGPWAVGKFVEDSHPHRFIQSFKSYAASREFQETWIFRRKFQFEDLLAAFLRTLLRHSGLDIGSAARGKVVIGRPVRFAGPGPDDALAMARYRESFGRLGIASAHYVYEPVGAAFFFAQRLNADATVLVADFGGGTSDFSLMRFERTGAGFAARPLGHAGIGIAGDAFDYRIIDNVVSPRLGKGGFYRSFDKTLAMPNGYYANFARWNHLAVMRSSREFRELVELERMAVDPEPLRKFIAIVENDLGFDLYRAVSAAKVALSSQAQAEFRFRREGIDIAATVTRAQFEAWIADDVAAIDRTIDEALRGAGIAAGAVDRVFLTGGSSFIPAIRTLFARRFGEDRLDTGDQFESIAYGLALIGRSADPERWQASAA